MGEGWVGGGGGGGGVLQLLTPISSYFLASLKLNLVKFQISPRQLFGNDVLIDPSGWLLTTGGNPTGANWWQLKAIEGNWWQLVATGTAAVITTCWITTASPD